MKFVILGSGARENIIIKKLKENPCNLIFCISNYVNPQINEVSDGYFNLPLLDCDTILNTITTIYHDNPHDEIIVVPGSEKFLEIGIVDTLEKLNIPSIGPLSKMAMIETSKKFCRNYLNYNHLQKYQPKYYTIYNYNQYKLEEIFQHLNYSFVVKADGLCGGKGVREYNSENWEEAFDYCRSLLDENNNFFHPSKFLIEEKLFGEEFSLMSFCDGKNISHMPVVQDYKNLNESEPIKTGGMGSVILANHSFPFLNEEDIVECQELNKKIMLNLSRDSCYGYRGILYGGFMKTKEGVKLIEYNARFGDPECVNILSLLKTPLDLIFKSIVRQELDKINIIFEKKNCVCQYLVPVGYPKNQTNYDISLVNISENYPKNNIYMAAIQLTEDSQFAMMNSRAIALVSKHEILSVSMHILKEIRQYLVGCFSWRDDIGKKYLISASYHDTGVDITEGSQVVEKIKDMVQSTHNQYVCSDYGGFSGMFNIGKVIETFGFQNPILVSSTDGVGTKTELVLRILGEKEGLISLGRDIVGHSVNDILVSGAMPLYFLDYVASSKIKSENIKYLLEGISDACRENNLVIMGGETAEMPGVYQDKSYDIVGTIVGIVDSHKIIKGPLLIKEGDIVLGLLSSGPHTNGYSLIRKVLEPFLDRNTDKNQKINEISIQNFISPHRSYYLDLQMLKQDNIDIHGLCHITGGGFHENIPRILPDNLGVKLKVPILEPFATLQKIANISDEEMYRVFNCGFGMLVIVSEKDRDKIMSKYFAHDLGKVVKLDESSSDNKVIIYKN